MGVVIEICVKCPRGPTRMRVTGIYNTRTARWHKRRPWFWLDAGTEIRYCEYYRYLVLARHLYRC
jgi:hypothetical protein